MSQRWRDAEISPFFNGWKEIAKYLGKGVRTVQRYETLQRLPVHRSNGDTRGAVMATKAELDAWVSASPLRQIYSQKQIKANLPLQTTKDIKAGLKQMAILRDEMQQLRRQIASSVHVLSESIRAIYGQRLSNPAKPFDTLVENTTEKNLLDFPGTPNSSKVN
jgi:hypothetical protein